MKKALFVLVLLLCSFYSASASEIVGQIYSTDILTFVNSKPIDGYNIGGRTVIIAEDLDGYGFNVEYSDETRTLKIKSYFHGGLKDYKEIPRDKVGEIVGNIYKTDIKVYYNGIPVEGYNIGGRTAVCIETLGELTGSANADFGYSDYLGKSIWNADERTISFESYMQNKEDILGISKVYHRFKDNVITTHSDEYCSRSEFNSAIDDEFSGEYTYSSGTGSSRYLIKPLYFDNHGEHIVIGTAVVNPNNEYETLMHIDNPEKVKGMIKTFKQPQKSHDEAVEYFTKECTLIEKIENNKYTVLMTEHETKGILFIYINKKGGFVVDTFLSGYRNDGTHQIKMCFSDTEQNSGPNSVVHSVYPFGGPHGTTTASFVTDLDEYDYE